MATERPQSNELARARVEHQGDGRLGSHGGRRTTWQLPGRSTACEHVNETGRTSATAPTMPTPTTTMTFLPAITSNAVKSHGFRFWANGPDLVGRCNG